MEKQQSSIDNHQSSIESPHPAFKLRHTLRGHTKEVYRMALSPDGKRLASPSADLTVCIWDLDNGKLLLTLKGHIVGVICVAWSPDRQTLAVGGGGRKYRPQSVSLGRGDW